MAEKEDMTNNELKIYFDGKFQSVKNDLDDVKNRLKKIEKEIHDLGNGKQGIAYRLDRLENSQKSAKESKKNRIGWIIALASTATALLGSVLVPLVDHLITRWLPL